MFNQPSGIISNNMEKEFIEFYKWNKQKAIIVKHNDEYTHYAYYTIYFKDDEPFRQITNDGDASSDFSVSKENNLDYLIHCPEICKEYEIAVPKHEIEKLNIKDIKVLFDTISYIDGFGKKAKDNITKEIHEYLNV